MKMLPLSPQYAVAPQITPADVGELSAKGIGTVICNRPDGENPSALHAEQLRAAVEDIGLEFHDNPVPAGGMTLDHVERQLALITGSTAPVLAYCASGTRSAILWAFAMAPTLPKGDILAALSQAGYEIPGIAQQIDALARQS